MKAGIVSETPAALIRDRFIKVLLIKNRVTANFIIQYFPRQTELTRAITKQTLVDFQRGTRSRQSFTCLGASSVLFDRCIRANYQIIWQSDGEGRYNGPGNAADGAARCINADPGSPLASVNIVSELLYEFANDQLPFLQRILLRFMKTAYPLLGESPIRVSFC